MRFVWLLVLLASAVPTAAAAQIAASAPVTRIVVRDGRHALLVDNAPYPILGAQANNSSSYLAMIARVSPTITGDYVPLSLAAREGRPKNATTVRVEEGRLRSGKGDGPGLERRSDRSRPQPARRAGVAEGGDGQLPRLAGGRRA